MAFIAPRGPRAGRRRGCLPAKWAGLGPATRALKIAVPTLCLATGAILKLRLSGCASVRDPIALPKVAVIEIIPRLGRVGGEDAGEVRAWTMHLRSCEG